VAGRPVVSVDHPGGLRTTYEPVDPSVAAGRAVTRGSPIGTLLAGHAGCPAGACLHWGLRRGETYLDPLIALRPPRVRLLPWRGGPFLSRVGRRSARRNGPRRRPQPA
jgi:murein DD-endopeptidase MepM/ murein hydrolase activator NlpD